MNIPLSQKQFEQFFQKPEGFFWDNELQMYYEHKDYRFEYPLEAIGNFNHKWAGWLAAQQVSQSEQGYTYTGTGSDYLDCVLGIGGFQQYGPIKGVKGLTGDD